MGREPPPLKNPHPPHTWGLSKGPLKLPTPRQVWKWFRRNQATRIAHALKKPLTPLPQTLLIARSWVSPLISLTLRFQSSLLGRRNTNRTDKIKEQRNKSKMGCFSKQLKAGHRGPPFIAWKMQGVAYMRQIQTVLPGERSSGTALRQGPRRGIRFPCYTLSWVRGAQCQEKRSSSSFHPVQAVLGVSCTFIPTACFQRASHRSRRRHPGMAGAASLWRRLRMAF